MNADSGIPEVDPTVPCMARMYDYTLGGSNWFEVDRVLVEQACAVMPWGFEGVRRNVRADRRFLIEVVTRLAGELGVLQFLDLGTGIPNADNVHAVAQQMAPAARIVYVDYDPVVLAHAHQLLRSTPEGATDFIHGDVRDPEPILEQAAATLDFEQPVALVLAGILHYATDDQARNIVETLLSHVVAGSWMVVTHLASDIHAEELARYEAAANESDMAEDLTVLRSHGEVAAFFDGLELIEPGIASLDQWVETKDLTEPPGVHPDQQPRPDDNRSGPQLDDLTIPIYGAVARKPFKPSSEPNA